MVDELPRRLAAILYADVAGYSRLTGLDEAGTHAQLSFALDLIADRIGDAGGRVVHYAGDAVLADFDSVLAATRCAIGIQRAIAANSVRYSEERRLLFRMGVNLGDVIVDRNDLYGDGVNVAARLEALAPPGGICVSEAVHNEIQGKIDAEFHDLGLRRLKNIEHPVRAFRVALSEKGNEKGTGDGSSETINRLSRYSQVSGLTSADEAPFDFASRKPPSIMILPFRNIGGGEDETALVDGFRLSIQSVLVKLSGLFLINAPAAELFREREISAAEAGSEAGVRYVLEGTAQIAGQRIRVTVQLTDAATAQVVWSEQYDRVLDDIFELQDEVTGEIVTALGVMFAVPDDSGDAYIWWEGLPDWKARENVLRGINFFYKGTPVANARARREFEALLERHPDLGQGAGLAALTHWLDVFRGWSTSPEQSMQRAIELAERAIEHGDPDGVGRMVLGFARLSEGRHEEALELAGDSAAVRSSCPMANALYGRVLLYSGQPEAAIRKIKHAIRAQRLYPPWMVNVLSEAYRDLGAVQPSVALAQESILLDSENVDAQAILCTDYSLAQAHDDAERAARDLLRLVPDFSIEGYARTKPYKNRENLETIATALRDAGLS